MLARVVMVMNGLLLALLVDGDGEFGVESLVVGNAYEVTLRKKY